MKGVQKRNSISNSETTVGRIGLSNGIIFLFCVVISTRALLNRIIINICRPTSRAMIKLHI